MAQVVRPERCVVAVDGPSGSGKSTVSRRLATAIDGIYLDTGAMYRAVTWAVLQAGVDLTDVDSVIKVAQETDLSIGTNPLAPHFEANGVDVDAAIRGPEVTGAVSAVAAVPQVRAMLVQFQQDIISGAPRIVVEGRDIASVVAPDADLKVYLTASAAARAQRRSAEDATDVAATEADLARRDKLDSSRAADPLKQADDATELDTTGLGIDDVVNRLLDMLNSKVSS
ncbi:cytidylate kinase [Actinoplanes sp. NBRC 14428]|uniref:Cytidylate kinase n=1 Tax=Pseudosporangium ferrugineum TaxID=439699 RepID=A0A2T0REI1_9ACTN|nr:(d)CMP kinase [Pseudosporangium ferrugineum]PRY19549.1 cytidylate kinase [Pseudosporangium ferrugineum]BCJ55864.1 cytidylate kinase [Actinoplanes sp. NBRC 14428]